MLQRAPREAPNDARDVGHIVRHVNRLSTARGSVQRMRSKAAPPRRRMPYAGSTGAVANEPALPAFGPPQRVNTFPEQRLDPLPLSPTVQEVLKSTVTLTWPRWGTTRWCRAVRGSLQRFFLFPLLSLTFRLRVSGQEHIEHLDAPFLLAANHAHPVDHLLILKALPKPVRRRMAIAAAAEHWRARGRRVLYPLLGNGFPLSRSGQVRSSLQHLGRVMGDGWSVLIFPEGKLTMNGPMQGFKGGVGFAAVSNHATVVPLRVHVERLGSPWYFPILKRGRVEIVFGKPLDFEAGTRYRAATTEIERVVRSL